MITSTASALTVKKYAAQLGVSVHSVLSYIASGELLAIHVGKPRSKRRSWRIPASAIVDFESRRSARGPLKTARRRQKKSDPNFVEYF